MTQALKILRMIRWSLLASIVLYSVVGEKVSAARGRIDPSLTYLFTTLGVAVVGAIFVVRRTLVLQAAESLGAHPEDSLSLNHWRTGYIVTYVLCEALALFGLVQRILGGTLQQSIPYYLSGFVLLIFLWARQPESASGNSNS
jgi:F0F1-type ATP synthase membrane subunit c/vacuolar-type H+-ATPase subunit K